MKTFAKWILFRRGVVLAGSALLLISLFYGEQNRRGRRAWEACKARLKARGENLDWSGYLPAAIPDEQNIFAAPKMQQWFVKGELSDLNIQSYPATLRVEIARVTVVPTGDSRSIEGADLVLGYEAPVLRTLEATSAGSAKSNDDALIPLIILDDVPLAAAIANLGKAANLPGPIDTHVLSESPDSLLARSTVSVTWTNISARRALRAMLENYNLRLVENEKTGKASVVVHDPAKPHVYSDSPTRAAISALLQRMSKPFSKTKGSMLNGCTGFHIFVARAQPLPAARIVVCADNQPDSEEVARFFPSVAVDNTVVGGDKVKIERAGSNVFSVFLIPQAVDARDYLTWTDRFESQFDLIRRGVERPCARMEGNYTQPFKMPIPNFVAVRQVAQTLAQRAQCCLLIGEPERALRELTLLHDLGRILEAQPSGKPMTIVAAMIHVAITGLYVEVVADGLRLHAWHQPELITLQQQLAGIDLPALVLESFREERAGVCHTLEITPPEKFLPLFSGKTATGLWQKVRDPEFWLWSQMPKGWVYRNMVTIASLNQQLIDGFEANAHIVRPRRVEQAMREIERTLSGFSPSTFMAAHIIPNYGRATRTTAFNQTRVNQALIACALERYHSSRGAYPAALDGLAPEFLQNVPADLINGGPLRYALQSNGKFLLYSVGWNERDEAGLVVREKDNRVNQDLGDWVWEPGQAGS